jgi:iron complex outermembrane receptor protein
MKKTAIRNVSSAAPSFVAIAGALLVLPGAANAQGTGAQGGNDVASVSSEIVVTAQRRQERAVDVPITITAISAQQIETANVQALPDIVKVTPGLRFDNSGAFFQPTIRGVGTPVVTSGGGSNVGIYVDGFYVPNPLAADFKFTKVQSVQVLKGPQGTLFGHNTTGGAILVQSADPSTTTGFEGRASYGRFNDVRLQGYGTFGLSENVAVDLEGNYNRGDGWLTDINSGRRVGDHRDWSVRTGIKADFGAVSVLLRYQHSYLNDPTPLLQTTYRDPVFGNGAPLFATPDQVTFNPSRIALGPNPQDQPFLHIKSDVFQGTIKADLGFADLTSYTQYRKETVDTSQELDFSAAPVFQTSIPNRNKTWSQEFLLTSKPGSKLQWTAGLFGFGNKDIYEVYIRDVSAAVLGLGPETFYVPFDPRLRIGGSGTNTKAYAGFVDVTYEITPQLFLTAGARYSHDEVTDAYYNSAAAPTVPIPLASIKSDHVTPRAVLRYKPDDRSSVYASFTRGYKAAIIDAGGSCQNDQNIPTPQNPTGAGFTCNDVKPETINAYEVGYKYNDHRFSFELSGFYYDYKNLQVSVYLRNQASVFNAASSEIYGLDGQVSFRVSDNFQINAAGAWTHARYKHFPLAPIYVRCATVGCAGGGTSFQVVTRSLDDVNMQRAPEFTGNVGAHYSTDLSGGKIDLTGNLYYSSKFYFGPSGTQFFQNGYATLSLRGQWTDSSDHFSIAVFGDNVTDKRYLTAVQYTGFGVGSNWSKPATYGVEFGIKF